LAALRFDGYEVIGGAGGFLDWHYAPQRVGHAGVIRYFELGLRNVRLKARGG
jgi:hypothetical protein